MGKLLALPARRWTSPKSVLGNNSCERSSRVHWMRSRSRMTRALMWRRIPLPASSWVCRFQNFLANQLQLGWSLVSILSDYGVNCLNWGGELESCGSCVQMARCEMLSMRPKPVFFPDDIWLFYATLLSVSRLKKFAAP